MIVSVLLASTLWFFAVNVYETWFIPLGPTPNVERAMGGWTHNGPYDTKGKCDVARNAIRREPYRDYAHALRYDPQPCRAVTYEEYIRETQGYGR